MNKSFQWDFPSNVLFGRGSSKQIPDLLKSKGTKPPIILTDFFITKTGMFMAQSKPACEEYFEIFAEMMGLESATPDVFIEELELLKNDLDITSSLSSIGVTEEDLADMSTDAI